MNRFSFTVVFLLLASPASAHLNPEEHGSFFAGASHPWFGIDHIAAMVAVGLWAVALGGSAVWKLPATFISSMVLGFSLALSGIALPFVEPLIVASVIVLGLLIATATKMHLGVCAGLVGVFGLSHGHAHGGELGAAGATAFGIGFVASTAVLHSLGVGLASLVLRKLRSSNAVRLLGAYTTLVGSWLVITG